MNTIITSLINDSLNREQPWLGPSLQFKEDSDKETFNNIVLALIGPSYSSSQVYILWGCVRTGAADGAGSGAAAVSAGAVFFNGEVYTVAAFTTANINSQYLASAISITNGSPDPVEFSDTTTGNVHNIRQWLITQGASGANLVSGWIPYVGVKTALPLINGFIAGGNSPFYRKDAFGNVFFSGQVVTPGGQAGIATLPAEWWPKQNVIKLILNSTDNIACRIQFLANGNVSVATIADVAIAINKTLEIQASFNIND